MSLFTSPSATVTSCATLGLGRFSRLFRENRVESSSFELFPNVAHAIIVAEGDAYYAKECLVLA